MEIFCVILGWLLAQATTYINDVKKSQKRKSAMLKMLFNEFNDGVLQTKDMLKDDSFYLPVKVNPWWENNKLLYYEELPDEAELYNKWNNLDAKLFSTDFNSDFFKHYVSATNETRNSLQKSSSYWQQPLWKLLALQLKPKKP